MASVSDRRALLQTSEWGMFGDGLEWAAGFVPTERLPGSGAHGESWLLKNNIEIQTIELEKKREKLEKGLVKVEQALQEALAGMKPEIDSSGKVIFDPNYADDYERVTHFNPHDVDDPEAMIEERQELKTELLEHRDEIDAKLSDLKKSKLLFNWNRRKLPIQLRRLDKPWEDFKDEDEIAAEQQAGLIAEEKAKKASEKKKKSASAKEATKAVETTSNQQPEKELFVAKLIQSGPVTVGEEGRRLNFTDASRDKNSLRSILSEGQLMMKYQWRYIYEKGKMDFESVFLLPIVSLVDVRRAHKSYESTYDAAFISPYMEFGSCQDVMNRIGGMRHSIGKSFSDELLLRNLKGMISCLGYLENFKIYHGNIKPSNIYISSDGFNLCIGDFCPPSELSRWHTDIAKQLANVPEIASPELYDILVLNKEKNSVAISKKLNPYKNDVFCLGTCFFYFAALELPKNFHRGKKKIAHHMEKLRASGRSQDLADLIEKMLTFEQKERPTWGQLMSTTERAEIYKDELLKGLGNLIGWNQGNAEDPTLATNIQTSVLKNQNDQENVQCSVM